MSEEVFFIAACADGHLNDAFLTIDEAIDFANKKGMTEVWRVLSDGPNKTFDEDRAVTVWTAIKVDEFIDDPFNKEYYARFVLHFFRLPATLQMAFTEFTSQYRLFCDYKGARYRVTGASTMGDVWLAKDFDRVHGYDRRVSIAECSGWSSMTEEVG